MRLVSDPDTHSTARRHRRLIGVWLILLAVALPLLPAMVPAQVDRVTVRVDGRPLFRVGPTDTVTAAQRALRIERRLATLLESPQALTPARVEPAEIDSLARVVTVSGVPVVTVTRSDAEDNVTSADALATQWARMLDVELRRAVERRDSRGSRLSADVQAAVQAAFARLGESVLRIVPRVLAALVVLLGFWLLAAAVRRVLRASVGRVVRDLTVENLIRQLAFYAIWVIGLIVAVDALGFPAQTVVTGLGLTGLALGFALKDIISNFVSGLLILALRPFQIGDQIVVGDTEGSVERIRLRATDIRTYDGRLVLVPNADVFTSRVTNNTESPIRRAVVPFHVGYDADLRRTVAAAARAVGSTSGVLADPTPVVRIGELTENDVVLEARFWTDSRRSDFTATQAAVRESVTAALRGAGVTLPNPSSRFVRLSSEGEAADSQRYVESSGRSQPLMSGEGRAASRD